MAAVDLNCDLGEGAGHDAALMALITSANIACGAHAGDPELIRATCRLAESHHVGVGAHPGFADRGNFGRLEQPITPAAAAALVRAQLRTMAGIAGDRLRHVKLHGALYNQVSRDGPLASAVAAAIAEFAPTLIVFALAGSVLARVAEARGLRVASEVFADRTYQADGSLTPRNQPGAVIHEVAVAAAQVRRLVLEGKVRAGDGTDVPLRADTICLHGDGPDPVGFALRLRDELGRAGVAIRTFGA